MGMQPQNRVDDQLFNIDRQLAALSGPTSTDGRSGMSNHQQFMLMQALRRKRQRIAEDITTDPGNRRFNQEIERRRAGAVRDNMLRERMEQKQRLYSGGVQ
jgi:hypothetical protein